MPCDTGSAEGWCYIDQNAKGCAQEILFSKDALKAGVTTSLQCLEASILGDASVITDRVDADADRRRGALSRGDAREGS